MRNMTKRTKRIALPAPTRKRSALLADVRQLIRQAREGVARAVDSGLTMLYWHVGQRVRQDILHEKRAGYGERIVAALGRQLQGEFGRGFGEKNLRRMVQFAEAFPDEKIVASLRRRLGWTHFKTIIPISDPLEREFYAEMCRMENWNTRTLAKKIGSMLFERTALHRVAALAPVGYPESAQPDFVMPVHVGPIHRGKGYADPRKYTSRMCIDWKNVEAQTVHHDAKRRLWA